MSDEPSIFLSYRRSDAGGHARALHDYLSGRFGAERIFFDRSTIESGDRFPERLRQSVEGCAVLLALIGRDWLDTKGAAGDRRLDDPGDFVRQEIALALDRGKIVIPVLFDDTPVPPAHRLPAPLKDLAKHDALTLGGKTFEYQTQRRELVRLLAKMPGVPRPFAETSQVIAERLFRVPWPRNPFFTGREDTLQQLRQALAAEKTAVLSQATAITGLGGVGKTQTALEYAYRHREAYRVIWWIDASGPAGLDRGVTELATDLALPGADPTDPERTRASLRRWLEGETSWLLILDNAEQSETLRLYLPAAPAGHAVITSRNPLWGRVTKLALDIWPRVRSVEFLAKRTDRADPAGADELAAELGDLPLALEQAAAYVEATGQSFLGYLQLYRTHFQDEG